MLRPETPPTDAKGSLPQARRWPLVALGLASILVVMLLAAVYADHRQRRDQLQHLSLTATWLTHNALLELSTLRMLLAQYALAPSDQKAQAIGLRFEILWGRVELLTEGSEADLVKQSGPVGEIAGEIVNALKILQPEIANLDRATGGDLVRMDEALAALVPTLRRIDQGLRHRLAVLQSGDSGLTVRAEILVFGTILGLMGLIILTAMAQTVRSDRLLAQLDRTSGALGNLVDALPNAVVIFDRAGRIHFTNRAFGRMSGHSGCGSAAELIRNAVGASSAERADRLASGFRPRNLFTVTCENGQEITVSAQWAETEWYGRTSQLLLLHDLTALHRAEEKANRAVRLAALAELSTAVAHEVNQPLTIIGAAAQNALRRLQMAQYEPREIAEKLSHIERQVVRAKSITDRMRVLGDQRGDVAEPIDLIDAVRSVAGLLGGEFADHEIEIELDLPPATEATVLGHRLTMEQVIFALLLNARDAFESAAGPCPGVTRMVRISIQPDGSGRWLLRVADNAGGFSPTIIGRAMEPFVSTKSGMAATGLGLSFCYGAIREMGGSMELGNSHEGAIVDITLPALSAPPQNPSAIDAVSGPAHREMHDADEAAAQGTDGAITAGQPAAGDMRTS